MSVLSKHNKQLDELVALDHAFGQKLTKKRQLQVIFLPVILLVAFTYIIQQSIWITLVVGLITAGVSYLTLLPVEVKQNYKDNSFGARNMLVNNIALSAVDLTKIPRIRVTNVVEKMPGSTDIDNDDYNELKADFATLVASINMDNDADQDIAYTEFMKKYKDDLIFNQFFEAVRALIDGKDNQDGLQMIADNHNRLDTSNRQMKRDLDAQKVLFIGGSLIGIGLLTILMYMVVPTLGRADVMRVYTHGLAGYIMNTFALLAYAGFMKNFYKKYYDRDLTKLGNPPKKKKNGLELTEEEQAEEDAIFMSGKVNKFLNKIIAKSDREKMDRMFWTDRQCVKFQYQRVLYALVGLIIGSSMFYSLGNGLKSGIIGGLVVPVIVYISTARTLNSQLSMFELKREVAFAGFKQRLMPSLKTSRGQNTSNVLSKVANLMSGSDRQSVFRLINDISEDESDTPYINFAKSFSNDPKAITVMQAVHGAFHSKDATAVVDSLDKQANAEYMAKIDDIKKIKIDRFRAVPVTILMISLIPLFGLVFTFVATTAGSAFSNTTAK